MRAMLVALTLSACVSTTLEPSANHPAHPEALPTSAERASAVLEPGFEPFERYADHEHDANTQTTADAYTCPMHPEVTESGPGRCPCGMQLVPAKKGAP
jgi:hypothetical protein